MEEGEGFKEKVLNAHQEVQVLLKQLSQQDFKEIQDKISLLETSINDIVQQRSITDSKIKELDPSFSQIEELRDRIDQIQANNVTETVSIKSQPQSETGNSSELMDYETLLTKKTDPALDLKKLEVPCWSYKLMLLLVIFV